MILDIIPCDGKPRISTFLWRFTFVGVMGAPVVAKKIGFPLRIWCVQCILKCDIFFVHPLLRIGEGRANPPLCSAKHRIELEFLRNFLSLKGSQSRLKVWWWYSSVVNDYKRCCCVVLAVGSFDLFYTSLLPHFAIVSFTSQEICRNFVGTRFLFDIFLIFLPLSPPFFVTLIAPMYGALVFVHCHVLMIASMCFLSMHFPRFFPPSISPLFFISHFALLRSVVWCVVMLVHMDFVVVTLFSLLSLLLCTVLNHCTLFFRCSTWCFLRILFSCSWFLVHALPFVLLLLTFFCFSLSTFISRWLPFYLFCLLPQFVPSNGQ